MKASDFKDFRANRKLTQKEAALMFGCTQSFISQMEKGLCPIPSEIISKILENDGAPEAQSDIRELLLIIKDLNGVIAQKDARITELTDMLIVGFTQGNTTNRYLGKSTKAG